MKASSDESDDNGPTATAPVSDTKSRSTYPAAAAEPPSSSPSPSQPICDETRSSATKSDYAGTSPSSGSESGAIGIGSGVETGTTNANADADASGNAAAGTYAALVPSESLEAAAESRGDSVAGGVISVTVKVLPRRTVRVRVVPEDTVAALIRLVLHECPELQDKTVKIIFKGRSSQPAATLESLGIVQDCVVHAVVSDSRPEVRVPVDTEGSRSHNHSHRHSHSRGHTNSRGRRRHAHTNTNAHAPLLYGEEETHGFDRLITLGFSHGEIAQLRDTFHANRDTTTVDISPNARLAAEDVMVDEMLGLREATPQTRPVAANNNPYSMHYNIVGRVRAGEGSNMDMVYGVIIGMLLDERQILVTEN
ncbi:hypothetical protein Pelo_10724 [Pelomyxa schiedti]|nr:hypothetical protein Pelo_10698 [Pelomyxa schiedti]KAH3757499.1 hypothetical protein Pelo_10724 [Pelomyxa schiedti]